MTRWVAAVSEDALKPHTPEARGAEADGVTNDAAAFMELMGLDAGQVELSAVSPVAASTPAYLLSTTVDIPYTKSLHGDGLRSRVRVPADGGAFDSDIIFRLNTTAVHDWVQATPNVPATTISNFVVHAFEAAVAGHNLTAFEFGGSHHFNELYLISLDQGIKQIDEYSDLVTVSRIYSYAKPDTANYLIDLPYTGDGVDINQVHVSIPSDQDYRPKIIRLRYKNGATVRNVVNGDILIEHSRAINVESLHMEYGQLTLSGSSGRVTSGLFYMRGRAGQKVSPVVVSQPTGQSSALSGVVSLEDLGFAYITDLPGSYPTDGTANFSVTGNGSIPRLHVRVRNLHRFVGSSTAYTINNQCYGVTCGDSTFDSYSHFASVESEFANGAWQIAAKRESIPASGGIDNTSFSALDSFRTWKGTTGTYYYRAVALYDTKRQVGRVGTAEASLSPVNGSSGVSLVINGEWRQGTMLRIFRGTSANSYNAFVDVPLVSASRLHDSGLDIGGFPWVARTAAPATTVNAGSDAGYELAPGDTETTSDAYGRATVYTAGSTAPTVGGWRKGDRILRTSPTVVGASRLMGWIRLTDCNSFAATHVMGTDWAELRSPTS